MSLRGCKASSLKKYISPKLTDLHRHLLKNIGRDISGLRDEFSSLAERSEHSSCRIDSLINNVEDLRVQSDHHAVDVQYVLTRLVSQFAQMQSRLSSLEENHEWSTTVQSSMADDLKATLAASLQPLIENTQSSARLAEPVTSRKNLPMQPQRSFLKDSRSSLAAHSNRSFCAVESSTARLCKALTSQHSALPGLTTMSWESSAQESSDAILSERSPCLDPARAAKQIIEFRRRPIIESRWMTPFGLIKLNVYHETSKTHTTFTSVTRIEALFIPRFKHGLAIDMSYDHGQNSRSLTNIRLSLPRLLLKEDPLVKALDKGDTAGFLRLFREGNYRPDDVVANSAEPLLAVSPRLVIYPQRCIGIYP